MTWGTTSLILSTSYCICTFENWDFEQKKSWRWMVHMIFLFKLMIFRFYVSFLEYIPPRSLIARPWKMVVGRLLAYWEGIFSVSMWVFWGVYSFFFVHLPLLKFYWQAKAAFQTRTASSGCLLLTISIPALQLHFWNLKAPKISSGKYSV